MLETNTNDIIATEQETPPKAPAPTTTDLEENKKELVEGVHYVIGRYGEKIRIDGCSIH